MTSIQQLARFERLLREGADGIAATEDLLAAARSRRDGVTINAEDIRAMQADLAMARRLHAARQCDYDEMRVRATVRLPAAPEFYEVDGLD